MGICINSGGSTSLNAGRDIYIQEKVNTFSEPIKKELEIYLEQLEKAKKDKDETVLQRVLNNIAKISKDFAVELCTNLIEEGFKVIL